MKRNHYYRKVKDSKSTIIRVDNIMHYVLNDTIYYTDIISGEQGIIHQDAFSKRDYYDEIPLDDVIATLKNVLWYDDNAQFEEEQTALKITIDILEGKGW